MGALEDRTRFEPAEVEPRIVRRWLDSGLVHPEAAGTAGENYSIAVPPPNVTGVLHMGHALNGSIQDALIRSNRMRGKRTKWILGTDHAGIATQTQVEGRIYQEWEKAGAFRAGRSERAGGEPYAIVIPPPNVTGSLHIGHALNNTLQDILCRFERMRGKDVLW